jgi:hypothetical protein
MTDNYDGYHCCVCGQALGGKSWDYAVMLVGDDRQYFPVHNACEPPPINYCPTCAKWRFWADHKCSQ